MKGRNVIVVLLIASCVGVLPLSLAGCAPSSAQGSGSVTIEEAEGSASVIKSSANKKSSEKKASEPVKEKHDFECDLFYVDVPDSWSYSKDGEANTWFCKGPTETSEGVTEYRFQVTGPHPGEDGNIGADTVVIGSSEMSHSFVGKALDGREVYLAGAGASFFAIEGQFEGDYVSFANGVVDPEYATITLKANDPKQDVTRLHGSEFIKTAREALHVPDDPSIVCTVGKHYLWSGAKEYIVNVVFEQNGQCVAGAACYMDGTPARNILVYTEPE